MTKLWDKKPPRKMIRKHEKKPTVDFETELGYRVKVAAKPTECAYCTNWLYDTMNRCGFCGNFQW